MLDAGSFAADRFKASNGYSLLISSKILNYPILFFFVNSLELN